MPKIEVKKNLAVNLEELREFKKGEKESELKMKQIYKKLKESPEYKQQQQSSKKDVTDQKFLQDPKRMENWSFCGADALNL